MGEAFITRRGGGKPPQPTNYTFMQLITSNTTWIAPNDGWYKIYCVGKSGNGGFGPPPRINDEGYKFGSGGGAGGNSGGVGISVLYLRAGADIPVTVTNDITSFGSYLSATAGGKGGDGQVNILNVSITPGGVKSNIVGNALGGNVTNSTGLAGGNGGTGAARYQTYGSDGEGAGSNTGGVVFKTELGAGGGGAGGSYQSLGDYRSPVNLKGGGYGYPNIAFPQYSFSTHTTPPQFTGGGGGNCGGCIHSLSGSGGVGCAGGIIIEKGVD